MQHGFKALFDTGEIGEVGVDLTPHCIWYLQVAGALRNPSPWPDAEAELDLALQVAQDTLAQRLGLGWRVRDWLLTTTARWLSWGLVVAGGIVGVDGALDGRIIPLWGRSYPSWLGLVGYQWHGWFAALALAALILGLLGQAGSLVLPLRLGGRKRQPTDHSAIQWAPVPGRQDYAFHGPSAAAAWYLADLRFFCQQRQRQQRPLPAWGKALVQESAGCAVSAALKSDGTFAPVCGWHAKLAAIHADPSITQVICACDDKEKVKQQWAAVTNGASLDWQPEGGWGCHRARSQVATRAVTFLACPSARALLHTWEQCHLQPRHTGRRVTPRRPGRRPLTLRTKWGRYVGAIVKGGLACLAAVSFLLSPCPHPSVEVWFAFAAKPDHLKPYHFVAGDERPRVKLGPAEVSVVMWLRAWGCGAEKNARWTAEVPANDLGTPAGVFQLLPTAPPTTRVAARHIVCGQWEWIVLSPQEREVAFTVGVQTDSGCAGAGVPMAFVLMREES